jgi:hypothetical protein
MSGGNFIANLGGLEHYKKYGYKGNFFSSLRTLEYLGFAEAHQRVEICTKTCIILFVGRLASATALTEDIACSPDWITVPYKCNRGIIHDGDLPHMSTPITSIRPAQSTCVEQNSIENSTTDSINNSAKNIAINSTIGSTKNITGDSSEISTKIGTANGTVTNSEFSTKDVKAGKGENESKREETPGSMRRVILGFNCFPQRVDECCSRAPEHSGKFLSHRITITLIVTLSWLVVV